MSRNTRRPVGRRTIGIRTSLRRSLVAAALLCACVLDAHAFGQEGHSIIAEIAQRRLSPSAAAQVRELLGTNASLASIASWADDIREQRPQTYKWHFVDVPIDGVYDEARDCRPDPARGDCVVLAIERAQRTLGDARAGKAERIEALMFIVHFVGDLHQPLHTVREDRGGNGFPVRFFSDPTNRRIVETNLHRLWDSGLIQNQSWDWGAYVMRLEGDWLPRADRALLEAGSIADWASESHFVARFWAYAEIGKGDTLGVAYAARVRPVLDRQLAVAGLRLAKLLNDVLR